ncbi:RNA polymerase sigma (SigZ) subunit [Ulvibacter sp. MAR_2010_11]|uniref:sigma-70 family RNA polymerase sigma factor n=1 Tax=Ulvibacter sp. MAR_2010_11 TaxID=1250229 RepID=UPI000C2CAE25|nr:sigma-70 family RNA polymerase sigma factor [Ulvibacter sp. MAR_2010_11]PKA84176.1 RNA polymerase sigma (SigZ) subunit [Ulvibacter sp. MAR_2010_11]
MQSQVTQLYNPLLGYVRSRVRNQEDAEDITQEVFFKLAKSNNNGIDNLKSWVYTIAKNTITDYYRKRQLETYSIEKDVYFDSDPIDDAGLELSDCIRAFVNQLPEEYRDIMILSELKDIPQKEIASRLNINYVTVRSKVQRGRKKLKQLLEGCCSILQGGKGSIMGFESKTGTNKTSWCD